MATIIHNNNQRARRAILLGLGLRLGDFLAEHPPVAPAASDAGFPRLSFKSSRLEIRNAIIRQSREMIDVTSAGDTHQSYVPGVQRVTVEFDCLGGDDLVESNFQAGAMVSFEEAVNGILVKGNFIVQSVVYSVVANSLARGVSVSARAIGPVEVSEIEVAELPIIAARGVRSISLSGDLVL